jgi:hypothetical protein
VRAVKELGLRPVLQYGLYRAALQSGWLRRRTPSYGWDKKPLSAWLRASASDSPESFHALYRESAGRFLFEVDSGFRDRLRDVLRGREELLIAEADDVLRGRFRLFGTARVELGFPPDWSRSPTLEQGGPSLRWELERHWTATEGGENPGDIKLLWEPARFGWIYPLARAFVLTEDPRYASGAWALIVSWREANPPNAGPHWSSGQEAALRVLALLFAQAAFRSAWEEQPGCEAQLAKLLAVHADRIPPTLLYARAQGNNHLLVEAAALYSMGLLYPVFEAAGRWKRIGRRWVLRALRDQVFDDGGYVQHSFNYQRLALQVGLWAARLAALNDEPLPHDVLDRLRRMNGMLRAFAYPDGDRIPNFGPNDGAHIFPWSACSFHDYRPTLQAGALTLDRKPIYPAGPWDEACLWYGIGDNSEARAVERGFRRGDGSTRQTPETRSDDFPEAGLHLLLGDRARGWLRCAAFKTRPGHSDQLHFGLWWDDKPIALDAGSYRYQADPPWDNALADAAHHNTLVVDGEDPMRRSGRFLWLDWAHGRLLGRWRSHEGALELVVAEHDGYRRWGVTHRRSVVRAGDGLWLVVDDLLGAGVHEARLGWLLSDGRWDWAEKALHVAYDGVAATLQFEAESMVCGLYLAGERVAGEAIRGESPTWGWHAPTYAVKEPALRLAGSVEGGLPVRILTWWSLDDAEPAELEIAWREAGKGLGSIEGLAWNGEKLSVADAHLVDPSSVRSAG